MAVPDEGPALIEATIDNRDIGFVHAGQDVAVKVQTFEFTRYGLMHGHVVDVTRDRAGDAQAVSGTRDAKEKAGDQAADDARTNGLRYVAQVALDRALMLVDGEEQAVAPAVTAEIKIGRRSVISYLLPLLQRYVHEGVRGREEMVVGLAFLRHGGWGISRKLVSLTPATGGRNSISSLCNDRTQHAGGVPGVMSWRTIAVYVSLVGFTIDMLRHAGSPECRIAPARGRHQLRATL